MDNPSVPHAVLDKNSGVKYVVMAHHPLSPEQVNHAIRSYFAGMKKKPKKGKTVEIQWKGE